MVEYRVNYIFRKSLGISESPEHDGLLGNLVASPRIDMGKKSPTLEDFADVILKQTEGEPLFCGQNVVIDGKNRLIKGRPEFCSDKFKLDWYQNPTEEFDEEISKIFDKPTDSPKRVLYTDNKKGSNWKFPLMVMADRTRNREVGVFGDYPNIDFEYKIPDAGITLVGFMYNSSFELPKVLRSLRNKDYNIITISQDLGEALRNPNQKISLVEKLVKNWMK